MTIATKGKGNPEGLAGDKYFISLIEHAADGIAILQDGVFKMVNTALARMSGYDKKELLGMPFTHLLTPQSQKLTIERYQARLAGKKVRPVYEIKAISKDGKIRDIEINAALTEYEGRVADEIIVRDVTERKQVEHNLQERMKELGGLYRIASIAERPGITLDEINQETVKLLPQGWQYPEVACAQLTIDGKEFRTANYRETEWKQFADIKVHGIKAGMVVVGYLEERPASDEGPFLKEERSLIDAVAERLGQITDRKQAEEALADEVTRRRILIDQSRDGIVVLDENGKVYEANQQFAEMLGYTPEEATQLHVWDWEFVFPREQVLEMIRSVDAAGDHFETQHRRKDGTTIDVEISTNGAICAGQKLIFCVCRDITERKQAEEELKLRAQILDGATDIIQVHDASDNFVYVNEAACIAYGYSREELMKMKLTQIVAPERLHPLASNMQELLETGHIIVESAHMRKDGSVFPVEVHARTIESGGGKLFLTVAHDITERKQSEEREKELQKELLLSSRLAAIGELAAGVAHQINNPLTGVLGFSQRLLRKSTDQETNQDLKRIYTEAERAAKVVQNLLTFARRRQTQKQYSDINDILESALELRAYELKTSNIEVVTDLTPGLPEIMLDFHQIQEVFLNIILNAEQAITEANGGGKLTIKTEERKGDIRTTFTDNGPGIPAENLEKIFDPFFSTKGEKGGTGLGLSVCHGIISEHGGRIYAKSKPGKGAIFFVELPLPGH